MYHLWYFRRSAAEKKGPLKNKNRRKIFTGGKGYAVRGLAIYIDYPGRILCFSLFFSSLCNEKNRGGNPGNTAGPYPEPDAASVRPKPDRKSVVRERVSVAADAEGVRKTREGQ